MEFKPKAKSTARPIPIPRHAESPTVVPLLPAGALLAQGLQRLISTPVQSQRQAARPVLQAAGLRRQEEQRTLLQRQALEQQARTVLLPADATQQVLLRQQAPPPPIPQQPRSPADWVTVMRAQAEQIEGRVTSAREAAQFSALQRQVAQTLVQGFRADRRPAQERHDSYAAHLVALQRHPSSAPVAGVVLGLIPQGERPALQRAVDLTLRREQAQAAQEQQALEALAIQRQLAELDAEATQPVLQRIQARRGGGNPLPTAVRRHLEQGLNHDLSRVRIHDDAEADKLAKGVNAIAFTTGTDIFFRRGQFNPNTQTGLELLVHEVTHTVQQSQGRVGAGIDPDVGLESEAREMGARLAARPMGATKMLRQGHRPLRLAPSPRPEQRLQRQKVPATTQVNADVALKMLDTYRQTGATGFKPELGKGGASWFVTKGNPYVGIDASKNIQIGVQLNMGKEPLTFREADLQKILTQMQEKFRPEAEATFRERIHQPEGALNSANRKKLERFVRSFSETKMWDEVAARIRASKDGVGRVILENSEFSKSGNGEFAVVTRAERISLSTSIEVLVQRLIQSGASAEEPVLVATQRLLKAQRIAGVAKGVFRYGGRILIVVAVAADAYRIYHARDRKLAVVETAGGWAGATAAGSAFAAWFTPADAAGPWAWAAHGVGTLIAGGIGYWAGSTTTRTIYELVLER